MYAYFWDFVNFFLISTHSLSIHALHLCIQVISCIVCMYVCRCLRCCMNLYVTALYAWFESF